MTYFTPGGARSVWRMAGRRGIRLPTLAVTLALGAACQPSAGGVELHAHLEAERPLAGLEVTILPYDVVGILDSLEGAADSPRPRFSELEDAMRAFRMRDAADFGAISGEWMRARATVNALADSLHSVGRDSPGYRWAFQRFRDLYDDLVAKEAQLEAAARQLTEEDRTLAAEAAEAADSLRRWERGTFRDFDAIAEEALRRSGREVHTTTTGADGRAALRLDPGRWWIILRHAHPENPFQEYFWNVPVRVNGVIPLVIPLSARNVTERWRH